MDDGAERGVRLPTSRYLLARRVMDRVVASLTLLLSSSLPLLPSSTPLPPVLWGRRVRRGIESPLARPASVAAEAAVEAVAGLACPEGRVGPEGFDGEEVGEEEEEVMPTKAYGMSRVVCSSFSATWATEMRFRRSSSSWRSSASVIAESNPLPPPWPPPRLSSSAFSPPLSELWFGSRLLESIVLLLSLPTVALAPPRVSCAELLRTRPLPGPPSYKWSTPALRRSSPGPSLDPVARRPFAYIMALLLLLLLPWVERSRWVMLRAGDAGVECDMPAAVPC